MFNCCAFPIPHHGINRHSTRPCVACLVKNTRGKYCSHFGISSTDEKAIDQRKITQNLTLKHSLKLPVIYAILIHSGSGSSCLDDNPRDFFHEPSIFHSKLPGQIMNATLQCRLQYGKNYFQCAQKIVRQLFFRTH